MNKAGDERLAGHVIRPVTPDDMEMLVNLVRELAVYEGREHHARATPDDFRRHLFGPRPAAEALIAEVAGEPAGFALWFTTFSTFRGKPGIYLEDLFVRQPFRAHGIGKALLASIARLAMERGSGWMGWSVMDRNEPAIGFYHALGAYPIKESTIYRLDDEPMRRLAAIGREMAK
jgi:GNAT superfamily N-acetyltransferase